MAVAAGPLLTGCVIGAPAQGLGWDDLSSPPSLVASAEVNGAASGSSSSDVVDPCQPIPEDASRADKVCATWRCARRDVSSLVWSGRTSTCVAGDIDSVSRVRALELVNAYRFLAGVEPVGMEATWEAAAQECALVAHANARLTHTPAKEAKCFSDSAAKASAQGLLANRNAPIAIGAFIGDPGNETTMVHRRWLLQEELPMIGIGSTDRYSCIVVDGTGIGKKLAKRPVKDEQGWVAWPPPGPVPVEVFVSDSLDTLGWTIQTSSKDLAGAKLEVRESGSVLPIRTNALEAMHGSASAIRFVPDGWTTEPGKKYEVHLQRGAVEIDYVVEPIGCR